jgi:hypothetical protein
MRLEAIAQQQQAMRNEQNQKATEEYRANRAKAVSSANDFNRTHIPLTAEMQRGNPELANIPLGTRITPELAKSKAGSEAAGTEAERFNRLGPAEQRTYLANKGRLATAGESPEAKMQPEDMKTLVNYTLAGNGLQYNAFGRSKEGQSNRALYTKLLREELNKQGLTEGDLTARQALLPADKASLTRLTAQKDQLEQFSNTLHDNSDLLLNIAKKIPDVGSKFGNRALREAFNQLGSQDVSAFNTSLASVQSEAARILNSGPTLGGHLTDSSRRELQAIIGSDFTYGQLQGAIATIKAESANRLKNQDKQIGSVTGRIGGRGNTPGAATHSYNPATGQAEPINAQR